MNTATTNENWNVTKAKPKQNNAQVTGDEVTDVEGTEDEPIGPMQQWTGPRQGERKRFWRIARKAFGGGRKKTGNGHPLVRLWL